MNPSTFDSIMKRFFERQSRRFLKDGIDASDLGAMSAIKNGAKTLEEIAVVVGWEDVVGKRQTIWYRLEKLEKGGWVKKVSHGSRELTPSGKARLASIERFLRKELCCGRKNAGHQTPASAGVEAKQKATGGLSA